jgi:hypothetical protein
MVRVLTIFKAGRLLNVDLFFDRSIEECTFHVHLIKLKAMVSILATILPDLLVQTYDASKVLNDTL